MLDHKYVTTIISISLCAFLQACERHAQSSEVTQTVVKSSANGELVLAPQAVSLANIQSSPIKSEPGTSDIKTTGEIKAPEPNVFHISSLVVGRVVADNANLGDVIKKGQILARVQNPEVTKLAGEYIHQLHLNEVAQQQAESKLNLAQKNLDRLSQLNKEGIVPQKDVYAAQNAKELNEIELHGLKEHTIHITAETRELLRQYGVSLDETKDITKVPSSSPLKSPRAGVIIDKSVTVGDVVDNSKPLYVVADLSDVWLDINIFDKDIAKIKTGEPVVFRSDSLPGKTFQGTISYVKPQAGDTRTFVARAVFKNPALVLKPGMFGQVEVLKVVGPTSAYVPDSALQNYNNETFVFIDQGSGRYLKRKVEVGERILDGYLVKSGLTTGEHVVTNGALTLKAELFKSQVGQGE